MPSTLQHKLPTGSFTSWAVLCTSCRLTYQPWTSLLQGVSLGWASCCLSFPGSPFALAEKSLQVLVQESNSSSPGGCSVKPPQELCHAWLGSCWCSELWVALSKTAPASNSSSQESESLNTSASDKSLSWCEKRTKWEKGSSALRSWKGALLPLS